MLYIYQSEEKTSNKATNQFYKMFHMFELHIKKHWVKSMHHSEHDLGTFNIERNKRHKFKVHLVDRWVTMRSTEIYKP